MTATRAEITTEGQLRYWEPGASNPEVIQADDLQAARIELIQRVTASFNDPFSDTEGPVRVNVLDPETGPGVLTIHEDGRVERAAVEEGETGDEPVPAPARTQTAPQLPRTQDREPAVEAPAETAKESEPLPSRREVRHSTLAEAFSETEAERPEAPATEGWQGALNRATGGLFKVAPGAQERRHRKASAAVQRGLDGHKTVAFLNIKGGASKTTNCYMLAGIFGTVRGGSVLAWDANENKGTLGDRSIPAKHDRTAQELLADLDDFTAGSQEHQLVHYTRPQGELRFDVLASQNTASTSAVIDGEGFTAMHETLRRFYRMIFVDTGNSSSSSTWTAAVEAADLLVICASNKEDQVKVAASTIDTLEREGHGDKIANAVFIISNPQNVNEDRLRRMQDVFGERVRAQVTVPFDRHLDDGGRIEWARLGERTKEAYLYAAEAITDGL